MIRSSRLTLWRAGITVVLRNHHPWRGVGWVTVRVGIVAVGIRDVSVTIRVSIVVGVVAIVSITEAETKVNAWPIIAASIIPVMPTIVSAIVVPAVVSHGTSTAVD